MVIENQKYIKKLNNNKNKSQNVENGPAASPLFFPPLSLFSLTFLQFFENTIYFEIKYNNKIKIKINT